LIAFKPEILRGCAIGKYSDWSNNRLSLLAFRPLGLFCQLATLEIIHHVYNLCERMMPSKPVTGFEFV
jgi:hypothetical protein